MTAPTQAGIARSRTSPPIWELGGRWRDWGAGSWRLEPESRRFREELSLPADRALVLTGHQSVIWHPGILAKYIAATQIAQAQGAAAAALVVNHDVDDPSLISFPVLAATGRLQRRLHPWIGAAEDGRMPAYRPAATPASARLADGESWPMDAVKHGVARMEQALAAHAGAEDLAAQLAAATADLAQPWIGAMPRINTLQLAGTTAFAELVERLRHDPEPAVRAYNQAVTSQQGHGVAPLRCGDSPGQLELPLWRIDADGRRQRLFAVDLPDCDAAALVPRALLMTGLVRLLGCDLFIHGTGGAAYDRVTDAWLAAWLGIDPARDLAQDLLVTATLHLPFHRTGASAEEVEAGRQALRRLQHDPAALGEDGLGERKLRLVQEIADLPRRSEARARLYRQMHALLAEARARHADRIGAAAADVVELQRRFAERTVLEGRDWPFPLYPQAQLDDLAAELSQRWGRA
ncbi:MAG: hypothetical protein ACF8R7_12760 [Phycisphaerales bacterium JB039]